jgi:hypothetical protein
VHQLTTGTQEELRSPVCLDREAADSEVADGEVVDTAFSDGETPDGKRPMAKKPTAAAPMAAPTRAAPMCVEELFDITGVFMNMMSGVRMAMAQNKMKSRDHLYRVSPHCAIALKRGFPNDQ